jgi:EAL domain-containing protein (putative c-di-GMP-specific phosphodiesterase class I)
MRLTVVAFPKQINGSDTGIDEYGEDSSKIVHIRSESCSSIDDFGTGYSSLNYLTRMKFDEMKIDKIFINKRLEEPKSFKLLEIQYNIAEVYDYDIVAEDVETQKQLEKISTTSLRMIQEYLFSKPESLE